MSKGSSIQFVSADGLKLPGTFCSVKKANGNHIACAILIHGGGGVNRDEDGFFSRLSECLTSNGIASLRFDHRAFLAIKDKTITVTISGMVSDISAAIRYMQTKKSYSSIHLISASFSAGATLMAGNDHAATASIILVNPLINYKKRLLEEKSFWRQSGLTKKGATELSDKGFLKHGSALKMKPPIITEVARMDYNSFWSRLVIPPTLIIHGTKDSRISHTNSLEARDHINNIEKLELIEGADHGLCMPEDDDFSMPQTIAWHNYAYDLTKNWIVQNSPHST